LGVFKNGFHNLSSFFVLRPFFQISSLLVIPINSDTDKEWGLIDCMSFIVMQDRGITEALTADDHFNQAGFKALLKG
jgi:hypothetical protein